ncbi:alpha/beta hydrolase [Rathayibacter sp. VKM Ac-2754]|uniref:alpha/beta hydrolase n=1 Tax=Rathayibacter sp. VKM Ac-2754 TaxID=2609251 RepID=UPI001359FE30|nr:alpha/beta hydrolase [Rathayibacter sp. VKM Ac-2754]MWV59381.1 alpha/beta hydrolase fold domain-containing protein [Rathayibacter sp. VKM Ac-2754]
MAEFHPDLRDARFLPRFSFGPRIVRAINRLPAPRRRAPEDLRIDDLRVPGPEGAPPVGIRIYRPRSLRGAAPALVWVHGGGMVIGNHLIDEASSIDFARTLGITVVSVDYRLSPQHVAPAAVEDVHAVITWLLEHAEGRGVDAARVAIGGASAGGGLAAGVAQLVRDRGEDSLAFQLLVYPMLDDRTVLRTDLSTDGVRMWTPGSNRFGWTSYLGHAPGPVPASPYAAPARRDDLTGLPPAWIGVGSLDLFLDEDVRYAERLREAGVACELEIVPGAFHGFDAVMRTKEVSRRFWRSQAAALEGAFGPAASD